MIWPPFFMRWPFTCADLENAFFFICIKYSKNLIKNVVKIYFSSYNKSNVRKRNMKMGGEIT